MSDIHYMEKKIIEAISLRILHKHIIVLHFLNNVHYYVQMKLQPIFQNNW